MNNSNQFKSLLALSIAAIFFLFFINPTLFFFLNDDFDSLPSYAAFHFGHHSGTRFTIEATLMLDTILYGTKPLGYIITNLLLHFSICFVGYFWLKSIAFSLGAKLSDGVCVAISLLFMWYAFHTETVVWVISRTSSLSLLFFLLGWCFIMQGAKKKFFYLASLLCLIVGMMAYENCWLLLFSLSFWWVLLEKHSLHKTKSTLNTVIVSWIFLPIYFILKKTCTNTWVDDYLADNVTGHHWTVFVKNGFALFGRSFLPPMENKTTLVLATGTIALVLICMVFMIWKRKQTNKLWWLLLFNWLASYTFFVSMGIDTNGYESERYLYFPSFFLCAWLLYSLSLLPIGKPIRFLIFGALLAYHVFFLNIAVHAFAKAGMMAKQTITIVTNNLSANKIFIEEIPTKYAGIPMFRFGFFGYLKWMDCNTDTSKIKIVSQRVYTWKQDVLTSQYIDSAGNLTLRFYAKDEKNNLQK